jgi:hypothetical protein
MFRNLLTSSFASSQDRVVRAETEEMAKLPVRHTTVDWRLRGDKGLEVEGLVPGLPRALQTLAHEPVVAEDGPHPSARPGAVAARASHAVLAGRATRVP